MVATFLLVVGLAFMGEASAKPGIPVTEPLTPRLSAGRARRSALSDALTARATFYLDYVIAEGAYELVSDTRRVQLNLGTIDTQLTNYPGYYDGLLAKMDNLVDTADMDMVDLVRMLYAPPANFKDATMRQRIETAMLNFRYWADADGPAGHMHIWTENHQINFHTCEYLAGSLYRDRTFTRTNQNGSYHAALGEARIMKWLDRRHKWGFSEWRSTTYFKENVNSLTALIELSPSATVATKAGMVLDLLMLDNAMHSFNGGVASSRGRNYGYDGDPKAAVQLNWLLGGGGSWDGASKYTCIAALAYGIVHPNTASGITYTHSDAVLGIAAEVDTLPELIIRERIGLGTDAASQGFAAAAGLTMATDPADIFAWMGMGAFTMPTILPSIIAGAESLGLFSSSPTPDATWTVWDVIYGSLRPISGPMLTGMVQQNDALGHYGLLGPANTMYYRTPNAALASVTDYNKGAIGDQQRTWQATLGTGTTATRVFTSYAGPNVDAMAGTLLKILTGSTPDAATNSGPDHVEYSAGYWTGDASLPKVGQLKNKALILYRPPPAHYDRVDQALYVFGYTHAAFPRAEFDQVYDTELVSHCRIAGKKGSGYVALWAASDSCAWVTTGTYANKEITAATGAVGTGAWATVVGDASTHGSFEEFVTIVLRGGVLTVADRTTMVTELSWAASGTSLRMGWESDLVYNDGQGDTQTATLDGYARYENPWVSSEFPAADELVITQGSRQLVLDFTTGTRTERTTTSGPTTPEPTATEPTTADTTPLPQTASPPPPTSSGTSGSADSEEGDSALPSWAIIVLAAVPSILVLAAICVGLVHYRPSGQPAQDSGNETANNSFTPSYSNQRPNAQAWVAPIGAR